MASQAQMVADVGLPCGPSPRLGGWTAARAHSGVLSCLASWGLSEGTDTR